MWLVGSNDAAPPGPRIFSRLPFGDGGLLAFQGLSRGGDLLMVADDSPRRAQP